MLKNSNQLVETYSTGMKKKLMIARALLTNPSIVFCDELFNGLDKDSCKIIQTLITEKSKECTFIIVSHQDEWILAGKPVLRLCNGDLLCQ